jgi:hypothetical protein
VPVNAENTFLLFKERRPFKLKKEYPSEQWEIISFRLIPLKTPVSFHWTVPLTTTESDTWPRQSQKIWHQKRHKSTGTTESVTLPPELLEKYTRLEMTVIKETWLFCFYFVCVSFFCVEQNSRATQHCERKKKQFSVFA